MYHHNHYGRCVPVVPVEAAESFPFPVAGGVSGAPELRKVPFLTIVVSESTITSVRNICLWRD